MQLQLGVKINFAAIIKTPLGEDVARSLDRSSESLYMIKVSMTNPLESCFRIF